MRSRRITLPSAAFAKYYDEHVSVCVCLSVREDIFGTTRAILFVHLAYMALARCASGVVAKSQGTEATLAVFFIIDNALYSIAKTAEPIKMPFGTMSGLGPRNSMLSGRDDP